MATIISKRGQEIANKREGAKRLVEKYMIAELPMTDEEKKKIERVFENIRKELDRIGR